METDNSAISGQLVHLTNDDERTQFIAIGTDTSTNTQFKPTYRVNDSKAPAPGFGAFGSFPWSVIQGFFSDWPTMSNQLLVLTQQEVDQYIPTGNVDDLTTDVTITKTIPKGNTNFLYGDTYLPIDVEITFKGSDLITDPAEPLELATSDKTIIGAVNENKDNTDSINTSFKALERDLLYNAVGNYIAQNPALSSYYPSRLNTIPVVTGDKIPSPDYTASNAVSGFSLKEDSDVNLLEATWTAWQNITKLNTNMYGISATNMPDLSATALIAELSGNSVIENLNLLYDMYLTGSDGGDSESGSDFTSIIDLLSSEIESLSADIGLTDSNVTSIEQSLTGLTQVPSLSDMIQALTGIEYVSIINQLSGLTQDLSAINTLSGDVIDINNIFTDLYNLDIPALSACCEDNRVAVNDITNRINNLDVTELSAIADMIDAIDINTYITQLSAVEQQIANLSDIQTYITNIDDNTINIQTNTDALSTSIDVLSGDMHIRITDLEERVLNTTAEDLSAMATIINNIQNVDLLLQELSGDTRIGELSACCDNNALNITNLLSTTQTNTQNISANTANIDSLSAKVDNPSGMVLTTTNQTITGEKTFKSTMTVAASSHFEDCVTVGDMSEPVVFNVYTDNGTTRVNLKNLPTETNINDLDPGDMYITTVDGHNVLAIKQDPGA